MTYINTPAFIKDGEKQHNNLGYRDSIDINLKKDNNCIRILAIGGSTTYGDGVKLPAEAWPKILENELNESIVGSNIQVINAGLPWGTSAELLNHYIYQDRYLSPDIVIIHTGINDIQPLMFNDYSPDYSNWRNYKSGGKNGIRKGENGLINFSNIIKLIYTIWYSKLEYAVSQTYVSTKDMHNIELKQMLKNAETHENIGFKRNMNLLVRNILQDSVKVIFFEPYLADIDNPEYFKNLLDEKDLEFYKIAQIAINKNFSTAKELCNNYGIEYLSMKKGCISPENMVDVCHLNVDGEEQKAEFILSILLESISNIKTCNYNY
ncbi:MAG TPA: GDSL-type esterase/lipase family protein [Bacteroidales bacterium]|nr:GDSL-type esterase/lipase family protein [Bacteroidales bacterium]